jgi:antitoxin HicB
VLDALSLLRDQELLRKIQRDWLEAEIQKGIDSAERGELIPAEEVRPAGGQVSRRDREGGSDVSASRTYTVILEPAEEGGYVVRVPALPEIVTEGDTEEEALAMAQDAIELVLESRHERGEPIPDDVGDPVIRKLTVAIAA